MAVLAVFEDVAGLAVKGAAEGLEGGEADGPGLAGLEYREVGGGDADFAASSPEDILRRASIMSMFTIIAMAVSLDGESVFFADSDRKAVDKGECEEYQRSHKH